MIWVVAFVLLLVIVDGARMERRLRKLEARFKSWPANQGGG